MEQEIKKLCSSAIYKRGTEYFRSGRVHIKTRGNHGFTAVVDDDGIYNVKVACDDGGNITDYFCTCPYYETMNSVCKHIVASCMERDREVAGITDEIDENERLSRILVSDFSRNMHDKLQLHLSFEFSFIKTGSTFFCEVALFINDKMIDNPEEFLECFTAHKSFSASKKLDYHPDTCTFGEHEEVILSFLAQSTESRTIKNPMYYKSVNSIFVGSECIKHIMPYLSEVDYKLIIDRMDMGRILTIKENPEILIDISAMFGEINLYVSNYGISLVPDGSVFLYEGIVYLTDKNWQMRFMPIYYALSEDCRSQITFKGETALSFATFVLPELEKAPGVVCDGLEEFVIKAEPVFFVYIDSYMHSIRCKIKVTYGEVSFFLPETKATDGYIVVRNVELEEKLLSCFSGFVLKNGYYVAEDDEEIYKFLSENIYKIQEMAQISLSDNFKKVDIKRNMPMTATVNFDSKTHVLEGEINSDLSDEEIREIANELVKESQSDGAVLSRKERMAKIKSRLSVIDKTISKLYLDNAEEKISDHRLKTMVDELEVEYANLTKPLSEIEAEESSKDKLEDDTLKFFNLVKKHSKIEELTRDTLLTFIDRIEIGERIYPEGVIRNTHNNKPFTQNVKIYYKFIKDNLGCDHRVFPADNDNIAG